MDTRDTSRDGFWNKLEGLALTGFRPVWAFLNGTAWLGNRVNSFLISKAVLKAKPRPHQFSTVATYTSWRSLTDKSWSGRHLPERRIDGLPKPEAVLDLFRIPAGSQQRMSEKSTFLFASFAQWFTDGFLMTDNADRRRNYSNHQIDLNPLYGISAAVTDQLRLKSHVTGKRGRMKSVIRGGEEFPPLLFVAGTRDKQAGLSDVPVPLNLPPVDKVGYTRSDTFLALGGDRANTTPVTAAIGTLFLREHNRVAGIIEKANPAWDDERVFETARNVLIVLLIKVVVEDYINHISPYWFRFRADPPAAWHKRWNKPNWIAIEFNLLYRWHGFVPETFAFDGKQVAAEQVILDNSLLAGAGLAKTLDQASRQKAGVLGLLNTVPALHRVELASIKQGRENGLASYNDYREAMKFPRVTRFEQVSGNPHVVAGLRRVYGDVDKIEFFAGLFAEDCRPRSAVPSLIGRMVALDAFSQAMTNPLLSENVFNEQTFSKEGMAIIAATKGLRDIAIRNTRPDADMRVSFDQV